MRATLFLVLGLAPLSVLWSGCPDPAGKRPIGGVCGSDEDCLSGICGGGVCLDPTVDSDGDTLVNSLEAELGSDPTKVDSDDDGIPDQEELDDVLDNVDSDADGVPDVVESTVKDPDNDCIPDQYDRENEVANSDLSPMIDVVCSTAGVCAGQRAAFGVACPDGKNAICIYSGVAGFADPEVTCDGIDQNCDGAADETFPDRDEDAVADCVDDDWDNDAVVDGVDNCPTMANGEQADQDADGVGDLCVASYTLFFVDSPAAATVGVDFVAAVGIDQKEGDAAAPMPPFVGTVNLVLDAHGGATTLSGTTSATAGADHVARFSGLGVDTTATGLELVATSGGLGPARSNPFDARSGALARFIVSGVPSDIVAGSAHAFTITPEDQNGNTIGDWTGSVRIRASDPRARVDDAELGLGLVTTLADAPEAITFYLAGLQTLTVEEVDGDVVGALDTTVADAGFAALEVVVTPGATAGDEVTVTVTARDAYGNAAAGYEGTVVLTSSDGEATWSEGTIDFAELGPDKTWTGTVTLETAGDQTVTATAGDVTGSASVTITPATAARLEVVPSAATVPAAAPFSVDVIARDAFDNVATGFAGAVALGASDEGATLPAAYEYTAADLGRHSFTGVSLVEAAPQTITATGPDGVTGSAQVTVEAGGVATLTITDAPTAAIAGAQFTVSLVLRDAQGNLVADGARTIRVDWGNGVTENLVVQTAVATLSGLSRTRADAYTVTLTVVGTSVSDSFDLDVAAAAATRMAMSAAPTGVAGVAHTASLTLYDAYDNVATGYRGTVAFTTTDAAGTAPSPYTFAAGDAGQTVIGGFVGRTAGSATIAASDAGAGLSANASVSYAPAAMARLEVTGLPASIVAGTAASFTVTAYDAFGNVATGYRGTVAVTSTDPEGALPASHTFTAQDAGAFTFTGLTLETAGAQSITVRDAAADVSQGASTVIAPAAATHLDVDLAASGVPAGVPTSVTITARDAFGNVATGYTGTVELTSGDDLATLPNDYTFTAGDFGVRTLGGVTFRTVGVQTLVATDMANPSITGADNLLVDQGSDIVFVLQGVPTITAAGASFGLTLRVEDLFGNAITDYTGTVHFDSDDPQDVVPADYTFTGAEGGVRAFSGLVLKTSGSRTLVVSDAEDAQITTSAIIDVTPGAMASLALSCNPTTLAAGATASCTVRAVDAYGNTATGYRGTVTFAADDAAATHPNPSAFSASHAGVRTFANAFGFETAGDVVLSVSDGAISDNTTFDVLPAGIRTLAIAAESATPTAGVAFYVDVSARDEFGNVQSDYNGSVAFVLSSGCDTHTNATLVNGAARVTGFRCTTAGARQIDVATTAAPAAAGSVGVTVAAAALDHFNVTPSTATPTAGVSFDLLVSPRDAFDNQRAFNGSMTFTMPSGCDAHVATTVNNDTTVTGFRCTAAGAKALSVAAGGKTGSGNVTVQAAALDHFTFVASTATPTAGVAFDISVRPRDAFENAVAFTGTMTFAAVTGCDTHANATVTNDTNVTGFRCTASGAKTLTGTAGGKSGNASVTVGVAALDHFTFVASTATPNAGASFDISVRPRDAFENAVTFSGTMSFTMPSGCDARADATLTNDTNVTGFRCTAAGARAISGAAGGKSGNVSVTVAPLPLHHFTFTPSTTVPSAGVAFSIDVKPRDDFDNVVTFTGTMTFTMPAGCDARADVAITNDTTVTGFRCTVAGDKLISGAAGGKSGSTTVNVGASAPHHFTFTPSTATPTAGATFSIDVKPRDSFENPVSYSGTMTFTMPSGCDAHANATITNDTTVTGFRCTASGAKAISGASSGVSGNTSVTVQAAALDHFTFTPSTATPTAGIAFSIDVKPRDLYENVVTYSGTMTFTMPSGCDPHPTATITNDTSVSGFRCTGAGSRAISGLASTKSGNTSVTVQAAALDHFTFAASTSTPTAGAAFTVDVRPRDQFENPRTYSGTMTFPSVTGCTLPASATITNDTTVSGFGCTLVGARTITGSSGGKSGQVTVTVAAAATAKLVVTVSPGSVTAGDKALTPVVEAVDAYGNRTPTYAGTITFTSDDGGASLPANYTFVPGTDAGIHTFSSPLSYLTIAGTRTVNARDTVTATITDDTPPTVTVVPSSPTSAEWKTHPANGRVNETLPTAEVQLKDFYGNVCTNLDGRAITVRVGTNPNEAVLTGTTTVNTVGGVSAFSTLKLDQHGTGFTLVASSTGLTAVTSNPFNLSWRAPTFTATPTATPAGGCTTLAYTLAQAGAGPATISIDYADDGGTATRATPLGTGIGQGDGLVDVRTSATGVAHTFVWDNFTDFGAIRNTGLALRVTATMPDGTSASATTATFTVDAAWSASFVESPIAQAITPGKPGQGDIDQDGFPDLVIPGSNQFIVMFYNRATGKYLEKVFTTNLGSHVVAAVGDMNDDGSPDVILADSDKDELTVGVSTINGPQDVSFTYETAARVCGSTAGISDIVAADLDRNGDLDVAVACSTVKQVRIWTRNADTWVQTTNITGIETPRALTTIDWAANGYLDVVAGTTDAILVIARNVQGAYAVAATRTASNVTDVAVGDLDADGLADIAYTYATATAPTQFLGVYFGKTVSSLDGASVEHDMKNAIDSLDVGDMDFDGAVDVVLGSSTRDEVVIGRSDDFRNNTATIGRTVVDTGNDANLGPSRVFFTDVDRNGRPDVTFARSTSAATRSAGWVASATSLQCAPTWSAPRGSATLDLGVGMAWFVDMNNDGKLDLVQASRQYANESITLSYGRGDGSYETKGYEISLDQGGNSSEDPVAVAFGDFNNDGLKDILVQQSAAPTQGALRRFHQVSAYSFTEGASLGSGFNDVVVGDFDLDGDDDYAKLTSDGTTSSIAIFYRAANSTYSAGPTISVGDLAWSLETMDMNRDGISDFVVKRDAVATDLCLVVSTNNSPPTWPSSVSSANCISTANATLIDLQLADLTGDGRKDVVFGLPSSDAVVLRTITTAGAWGSSPETGTLCSPMRGIAVGDVDRQRGNDLVLECGTDSWQPGVNVYPQQASLPRYNAQDYVSIARGWSRDTALVAADLDGGYADVSYDGLTWRNDAPPLAYAEPPALTIAPASTYPDRVDVFDQDQDGDPDVVTAGYYGNAFWVANQNSSGGFAAAVPYSITALGDYVMQTTHGDFNGDGRPDIATGYGDYSAAAGTQWYVGFWRRAAGTSSGSSYSAPAAGGGAIVQLAGAFVTMATVDVGLHIRYVTGPTVIESWTHDGRDDVVVAVGVSGGVALNLAYQSSPGVFEVSNYSSGNIMTEINSVTGGLLQVQNRFRTAAAGGRCATGTACVRIVEFRYTLGGATTIAMTPIATLDIPGGTTYATVEAVKAADLDNDGDDDLVSVASFDYGVTRKLYIHRQSAAGTFTLIDPGVPLPEVLFSTIEVSDVDRDGRLDVVMSGDDNYGAVAVVAYSDPGSATIDFFDTLDYVSNGRTAVGAFPADLSGDGRPDIVTVDYASQSIRVLEQR